MGAEDQEYKRQKMESVSSMSDLAVDSLSGQTAGSLTPIYFAGRVVYQESRERGGGGGSTVVKRQLGSNASFSPRRRATESKFANGYRL